MFSLHSLCLIHFVTCLSQQFFWQARFGCLNSWLIRSAAHRYSAKTLFALPETNMGWRCGDRHGKWIGGEGRGTGGRTVENRLICHFEQASSEANMPPWVVLFRASFSGPKAAGTAIYIYLYIYLLYMFIMIRNNYWTLLLATLV